MAIAKIVKPTTKNSSPMRTGHAKNNGPAEQYEKNGTGVAAMKAVIEDGHTNKLFGDVIGPGSPAMMVSAGNRNRPTKTEGVETRGNGAATKGRIARGPMA